MDHSATVGDTHYADSEHTHTQQTSKHCTAAHSQLRATPQVCAALITENTGMYSSSPWKLIYNNSVKHLITQE